MCASAGMCNNCIKRNLSRCCRRIRKWDHLCHANEGVATHPLPESMAWTNKVLVVLLS